MKTIQVHQVDAFTDKIFGGNPAGVVFEADKLTDDEMKNIAREMNLSETAFVLKPTQKDADVKLRYFTCGKAEITFCGHATMGSLYEIARIGLFGTKHAGVYQLNVETNAGILSMEIIKKSDVDISVMFTAPQVQLETYKSQHKEFAKRLDIPVTALDQRYPIMIDRNLNYLYLTINSLKELGELNFNFQQIISNFKQEEIVVFCLLTPETFGKANDIHARGIAPLVGVPEDPFTGSMQAGLATYTMINNILSKGKKQLFVEQGHFIGRPGLSKIELPSGGKTAIKVSAKAAHVLSGEMSL